MKHSEAFLQCFLTEFEQQLVEVPAERRQEIIAETRGHLESMLVARRMDGLDEASACQEVLQAFGSPKAVGNEFNREWRRPRRIKPQERAAMLGQRLYELTPYVLATVALMPLLVAHALAGPFIYFLLALNGATRVWRHYQRVMRVNPLLLSLFAAYVGCFAIASLGCLAIVDAGASAGHSQVSIQHRFDSCLLACGLFLGWSLILLLEFLWILWVGLRKVLDAWRRFHLRSLNSAPAQQAPRLEQIQTLLVGAGMGVTVSLFGGIPSPDATIILLMCFVALLFPTVNRRWPLCN